MSENFAELTQSDTETGLNPVQPSIPQGRRLSWGKLSAALILVVAVLCFAMAIARGGPTRSRSESVAMGIQEWSSNDLVRDPYVRTVPYNRPPAGTYSSFGPGYGGMVNGVVNSGLSSSDPINYALSHSSVTGARGSGVVANTNAKGNRYFSDSRCSCPSIDGSDGGEFCGVEANGLYQGRRASIAEVISDPAVGCESCFQRCYELNPETFCPMLLGPSPCNGR